MLRYASRQIAASIVNLVAVVALVFSLVNILPSDPARVRLGARYNERDAAVIREQYGLNRPLPVQFGLYLIAMGRGDLGTSILTGERISDALAARVPSSVLLIALSLVFAIPWALLGILAALRESPMWDRVEALLFTLAVLPVFVVAVALVYGAEFWFGTSLMGGRSGDWSLGGFLVPATVLSIYPSFALFKICRESFRSALSQPYAMAHRTLGFSEREVVLRFAMRNCAVSILGIFTNFAAYFLSTIFVVEFVFSLGGFGGWAVNSARNYDVPVVLATVIVSALVYNVVNVATALAAPVFDPRIVNAPD